ncbi:MAG: hypothetical protein QOD86_2242 [Miltoncostaeaceae bacterium]|nr:hypothetical protein [Miltoncostaeaceae bacterium]
MEWDEVLRGALSFFLVVTGIGLAYLFLRMAGVFAALQSSVKRVTDEVVPLLDKAGATIDGVNQELARVDEIMVSAVGATKGAERAVQTAASAISAPVRKLSGFAAGMKEGFSVFRARRASEAAERAAAAPPGAAPPPTGAPPGTAAPPPGAGHQSPY